MSGGSAEALNTARARCPRCWSRTARWLDGRRSGVVVSCSTCGLDRANREALLRAEADGRRRATEEQLADLQRGMAAVLRLAVVERWWVAPGLDALPDLFLEVEMGEAAARLLARGEKPWRVVRQLGRRWPEWARLMPELVRAVIDQAQGGRRAA